jgi:hypothetical protein
MHITATAATMRIGDSPGLPCESVIRVEHGESPICMVGEHEVRPYTDAMRCDAMRCDVWRAVPRGIIVFAAI